jgi:formylglycine-generating enzyme required for sulfatase activity
MGIYHDEMEVSYAVDFGRDREPKQNRSRHPEYRRKGSAPARVNGMHCRRNKRWTWGSGRGARMQNVRAFAGCLAFAVASLAASVFAAPVNINFGTVGDPGNTGNGASSPSGLGAVSQVFKMATTETTNSQYMAFLNAVDPNGTNPNSIYNGLMGSNGLGGINFNAGNASGSKYSVKSGAPAGAPAGTSYGSMPVNFVTWFSAARFVNWLHNGQVSGTAAMETGAYTLNGATSGAIAARNPGAQVFLPSQNEWYKAAFYNGSSYTTYATNSNTAPTQTVSNVSLANAANFGNTSGSPINVGSYVNSASGYSMYDMFGNVGEMTDTASGSSYVQVGGGFAGILTAWTATSAQAFRLSTAANTSNGFRVAAVPEPGTIALAGMGIAGLAGLDWMKRRKKRMAARQAA